MVTTERKTKEERREEILDAAFAVFAEEGLHGSSTEEVARRAGISQPYVFRLFGTKKDLFMAVVGRCFRRTLARFQGAAEGKRGDEGLPAIGEGHREPPAAPPGYPRPQMEGDAGRGGPPICPVGPHGERDPGGSRGSG